MSKYVYLIVLCTILFIENAAAKQLFKGIVIDVKANEPIPYVNIGIVHRGIGTVSDEEGQFLLFIDESKIGNNDIIQFSSLGYQTIEMSLSSAQYILNEYSKIEMRPADIILNEVIVSVKDLVPIADFVGYRNNNENSFGYWKDNDALGGELATRIVANKTRRRLKSVEFEVLEIPSDSLLLRVNIYDIKDSQYKPNENMNTSQKNILHTLKKDELIVKIDLDPYDIYVEDDFYVSLELVKRFNDQPIGLVLAASDGQAGSFRRYASQGTWEKISDVNMAFHVESTVLVDQKKARKLEAKVEKAQLERKMVSGFAIFGGQMISGINVFNKRTKETIVTDENGRYVIHAEKNDILYFTKTGYKIISFKVGKQQFTNAIMRLE